MSELNNQLISPFRKRNSEGDFKKLYKKLFAEVNNYPKERMKCKKQIREISTLYYIIDEYKPSYIEYSGGDNSQKDGILYFNQEVQYIEEVGLIDGQEMKAFSETGSFSLITGASLVETMEFCNWPEDQARKYLKSSFLPTKPIEEQIKNNNKEIFIPQGQSRIPEDFLYEKIIYVLYQSCLKI